MSEHADDSGDKLREDYRLKLIMKSTESRSESTCLGMTRSNVVHSVLWTGPNWTHW